MAEASDAAAAAAAPPKADKDTGRLRGAGGTPGGLVDFVIGLALAVAGIYMLTSQVSVVDQFRPWPGFGWYGRFFGTNAFGPSLIPFIIGTMFLFFNGRSLVGWLLLIAGGVIILAGILMHMQLYFQPTSLFNTLLMLGLLAAGVGLMARGLQPMRR